MLVTWRVGTKRIEKYPTLKGLTILRDAFTVSMDLKIEMEDSINWMLKAKLWKHTRIPQIASVI